MSILQNEKYAGNALLQKAYTVDFLTKKKKKNEGEIPQYFVENSHPAIIAQETFDMVQAEIKRRKEQGSKQSGQYCFSGKVVCGECKDAGRLGFYGSKVWHSTGKYRRVIWQCNNKFKNGTYCKTPHLYEEDFKRLFVEAFNRLYAGRTDLTKDYGEIIFALTDTAALEKKSAVLTSECEVVMELIRKCVEENSHSAQDQGEYQKQYEELVARYETSKGQLDGVKDDIQARRAKRERMERFFADLGNCGGLLTEFDQPLWYATVEAATIGKKSAAFTFMDGTIIEVKKISPVRLFK